nr:zinc finger, CCHC-type [Tanacetum cinerariifolium]
MNTIELPVGNNVVPLRSDTICLVQNGYSFHGLRSEDPNQHLKDFLKLVDSFNLDGENRRRTYLYLFQFSLRDPASNWLERLPAGSITTWKDLTTRFLAQLFLSGRTAKLRNDILMFKQHHRVSLLEAWTCFKDLLQKVPHHGINHWLQIQNFYDHVSFHLKCVIDRATGGKLRDKNADESWDIIENLALYDHEGWNDTKEFVKPRDSGILWKLILLFPDLRVMVPLSNLITVLAIVRNGVPKMKVLFSSSLMYRIMKSMRGSAGYEFLEKPEHFNHSIIDLLVLLENGILKSFHSFALMVIKGKVLNDIPRFFGILIAEFAASGSVNHALKMKRDMIIKNLDLKPMIDAMMRDFLHHHQIDHDGIPLCMRRRLDTLRTILLDLIFTHQQSLADSGSETRPPMLERGSYIPWESRFKRYLNRKRESRKWLTKAIDEGPYEFRIFTHFEIEAPRLQKEEGLRGGEALVSVYNRFTQLINDLERNNIIFPNVTLNTKFLNCLQPEWLKKCCSKNSKDPLTSVMILLARPITQRFSNLTNNRLRTSSNTESQAIVQGDRVNIQSKNSGNDGRNIRRSYVQEEIIQGYDVQNDAGNIQRTLRTTSFGTVANVQCYNCSEKGYYARNCPKPRVLDSKYFMEQMLLAKQDEAGVIQTNEQNDFLFADASRMEEIEEMVDEHLDTIPKTKSDEFIKSSVENLVPTPSVSEDKDECDVPARDDFTTFSNLLFDADDKFSSSVDKSFSDENILKKIYSNPLFDEEIISMKIDPHHLSVESDLIESLRNHDSSIIYSSLKIDSLLNEFAGELILLKSILSGIDETDCDPEDEIHLIEILLYDNSSPRPLDSLMEEFDLTLTPDDSMLPIIEDDYYDSERDVLILEEFLSNDSLSLPENESFHFEIPSSPRPPTKPHNDEIEPNLGILTVKVVGVISEHYVLMPRLFPTQPTLASNQEKSPHLLSHRGLKAFQLLSESPMIIYRENIPILDVSFLHFYPP